MSTLALDSILPVETLAKYEMFAVLPGKQGKGRKLETQAHNETEARIRGEIKAEFKYKIPMSEIKIHQIARIENLNN